MSFIVFDMKCRSCDHQVDDVFMRRSEVDDDRPCPVCGDNMVRLPPRPNLDWDALAMGESASPEAIRHWEKKRAARQKKEEKAKREHGDYGPASGA